MFNPSSFIGVYSSTDKVIKILDTLSNIVNVINICKYQKSSVVNNFLNIFMDDNINAIQITFNSNADALTAITNLKNAINTLKPNCKSTIIILPVPTSVISLTYLAFKTLSLSNSLVELQWYDVSDTTSLLMNTNNIYRVQVINTNDGFVSGKIISENTSIKIDLNLDKINYYHNGDYNNLVINSDMNNIILTNCTNCIITNQSQVNLTDCNNIYVDNQSSVVLTNCNQIRITNNSNIDLTDCNNINIDNQNPGAMISGIYTNINIDRSSSIGKNGKTIISAITTNSKILNSYIDNIDIEVNFDSVSNTIQTLSIRNHFPQTQSIFRIKMSLTSTSLTPNSNIIKIYDNSTSELLYIIQQNEAYNDCIISYNNNTNKYEFTGFIRKKSQLGKSYIPSFIDGQTVFEFTSILYIPVTQPTEIEMYINGMKQVYGIDYYYNSTLGQLIYTNLSYPLEVATEIVEFIIY